MMISLVLIKLENRKPNTKCASCKKDIYRRPSQIENYNNVFCSRRCRADFYYGTFFIECKFCQKSFKKKRGTQIFCSKICSGKFTRNKGKIKRVHKNTSVRRLEELKNRFDFNCCMVEGCNYSKTFDIHRLVEGKDGGKYIIGNMFAICPNHHAEVHRRLIKLVKINDYTLKEMED